MRLSPSYYPDYIDYHCFECSSDVEDVKVDSIQDDSVIVFCPACDEVSWVKVID